MRYALLTLVIASSAAGDVFRVLEDPHDAAQARVDLIQQAASEIDAVYFLARNDRIALTALALLRDAHRRGVGDVRLIVDANFAYFGMARMNYIDRDVYVEGPSAMETDRHFENLWSSGDGFVKLNTGADWSTGQRDVAAVHFLHDPLAIAEPQHRGDVHGR